MRCLGRILPAICAEVQLHTDSGVALVNSRDVVLKFHQFHQTER
jgi:hypothetical protein